MISFWRTSLMARLVGSFLLLSLIIVGSMCFLALLKGEAGLERSILQRLNAVADHQEAVLDRFFRRQREIVIMIARLEEVLSRAKVLLQDDPYLPRIRTARAQLSKLLDTLLAGHDGLKEIFILTDPDGQVILSTDETRQGLYQVATTYFLRGREATYTQTVYPSPEDGSPRMTVATPLLDGHGRRFGVLAAHLDLDHLDELILERTGTGLTGESYLVDQFNVILSDRRRGRGAQPRGAHSWAIERALEGVDGQGSYTNYRGEPVIGVYRWLENWDVALVVEMGRGEAMAPARRLAWTIGLIGLAAIGLLAVGVSFIARKIVGPIKTITEAAQKVAGGELTQTVPQLTDDEVGTLARTFNQMTAQLNALYDAVKRSEAHFRSLIENAMDITVVLDAAGVILYASPSVERLLGHDPERLIGRKATSFVHPDDVELVEHDFNELLARPGEAVYTEMRLRHRRGDWRILGVIATNLLNDPAVGGLVLNGRDMTERKLMEEALAHRARLDELIASLSTGFIELSADQIDDALDDALAVIGRFCEVDRSYIFLFSEDGRRMSNTHEWCAEGVEPQKDKLQDLPATDLLVQAIRRREVIHLSTLDDIPPKAAGLREFLEGQGIVSLLNVPLIQGERTIGFLGFDSVHNEKEWAKVDIVALKIVGEIVAGALQRKWSEEALRESEERLRLLFEEDLTADVILSPEGRVVDCNQAFTRIFGFKSTREAKGVDFAAFYPSREDYDALVERVVKEGRVSYHEAQLVGLDGQTLHVVQNLNAEFDEAGCLTEIRAYLFDDTERVRLEEQLRESQKQEAIGRLAGGVAHDFNNLLTAITGYTDLLLTRLDKDSPLIRHVEEIKAAGQRAAALTSQLLAFSRRQVLKPRTFDLNKVVAGMQDMLRRLIGEIVELTFSPVETPAPVLADPSQIEQVIMNLVVNVRDAVDSGGRISIETSIVRLEEAGARTIGLSPGEYVVLTVTDTGHGMDEETISHLFEPFFTTKEKGKGTGLGLSVVYGIIKQSGGHITVWSRPGQGARFSIYLPFAADYDVREEEDIRDLKLPGGTETILVVEDDDSVRDLVCDLLGALGYRIFSAANGEDALKMCRRRNLGFQLLLTDVVMPGTGGLELAERLAELKGDIKVVYMSGYTNGAVLGEDDLTGSPHFLAKPFTAEQLAGIVRQTLDE